jgi:hypothetical protein
MSRGTLFVKFPDGAVRYGIYNGTSDFAQPPLFDHPNDAWEWWSAYYKGGVGGGINPSLWFESLDDTEPVLEPVTIYTDYGGGMSWECRASRQALSTCACEPWVDENPFSGELYHPGHQLTHYHDRGDRPEWALYLANQ